MWWFLPLVILTGILLAAHTYYQKCNNCGVRSGFSTSSNQIYAALNGVCPECQEKAWARIIAEDKERDRQKKEKQDRAQIDIIVRALDEYHRTHPNSRNL